MNVRNSLPILIGLLLVNPLFIAHAAPDASDAKQARMIAIMEQMDTASAKLVALENTLLTNQAEIGAAVGVLLAEEAGVSGDLVAGREAEFGRAITNVVRTFQMNWSYEHRANDALVKRDLEWLEYLKRKGVLRPLPAPSGH